MSTYISFRNMLLETFDKNSRVIGALDLYFQTVRDTQRQLLTEIDEKDNTCSSLRLLLGMHKCCTDDFALIIWGSSSVGVDRASSFIPNAADTILAYPMLPNEVHSPGARWLVATELIEQSTEQNKHLGVGVRHKMEICNNKCDLYGSLLRKAKGQYPEKWVVADTGITLSWGRLFIFGVGSGYVTDSCICLPDVVGKSLLPGILIMAELLLDQVEQLTREEAVRVEVDGTRVWRCPAEPLKPQSDLPS